MALCSRLTSRAEVKLRIRFGGSMSLYSDVSAISSRDSPRKTVMICDDDPDLLQVYKLALRSKYDIVTASSGMECIQKYSDMRQSGNKVDVLLLDYRLGDVTGDEVAIKIKSLDGTKIILISAYEIESSLANDLESKGYIATFVRKPVSMQTLGSVIETAIKG